MFNKIEFGKKYLIIYPPSGDHNLEADSLTKRIKEITGENPILWDNDKISAVQIFEVEKSGT